VKSARGWGGLWLKWFDVRLGLARWGKVCFGGVRYGQVRCGALGCGLFRYVALW
jgi:hypothetical protein